MCTPAYEEYIAYNCRYVCKFMFYSVKILFFFRVVSDSGSFDAAVSGVGFDIGISMGEYPVHAHRQFVFCLSVLTNCYPRKQTQLCSKNLEIEIK